METVLPAQTRLCVTLTLEPFKQMGCDISTARLGHRMARIKHIEPLQRLADYLYNMLEQETGLIELRDGQIIRTSMQAPTATNAEILQALLHDFPEHHFPHESCWIQSCGCLVWESWWYSGYFWQWRRSKTCIGSLCWFPFESRIIQANGRLFQNIGFEITNRRSSSANSSAWCRNRWNNEVDRCYSGKPRHSCGIHFHQPCSSLCDSCTEKVQQDVSIYAISELWYLKGTCSRSPSHPTRRFGKQCNSCNPQSNHVTEQYSEDIATGWVLNDGWDDHTRLLGRGLLEGWWLFDDGRKHAIAHESRWESNMKSVGFDGVDWSNGHQPETVIQRIFIALNSPKTNNNKDSTPVPMEVTIPRQPAVDAYIE